LLCTHNIIICNAHVIPIFLITGLFVAIALNSKSIDLIGSKITNISL
jgi:hypothetical protein